MLKFDVHVKLGRVTSGAKIAVGAFKQLEMASFLTKISNIYLRQPVCVNANSVENINKSYTSLNFRVFFIWIFLFQFWVERIDFTLVTILNFITRRNPYLILNQSTYKTDGTLSSYEK